MKSSKTWSLRRGLITLIIGFSGLYLFLSFQSTILTRNYIFELPLNEVVINAGSSNESNTILFIGHVYGDPKNHSVIPSRTLIESIDTINQIDPGLVILMGDMSFSAGVQPWQELSDNFLGRVNAPIINSPGNHDLAERRLYNETFGQTYYFSRYLDSQIIVLDSIIDSCSIKGRQKAMLKQALDSALSDSSIKRILIISHRLIYMIEPDPLAEYVNITCRDSNFEHLAADFLLPASAYKPIFIFSGDVGADKGGNLSPYFGQYPGDGLYTIAVGLGNAENDRIISVDFRDSIPKMEVISLAGAPTQPLEDFSTDFWLEQYGKK